MPAVARVVKNERRGDGTILSEIRVTAPTEGAAERQAMRAALRENGYSDVFLDRQNDRISVKVKDSTDAGLVGLRRTYVVNVEISGAGEFLDSR